MRIFPEDRHKLQIEGVDVGMITLLILPTMFDVTWLLAQLPVIERERMEECVKLILELQVKSETLGGAIQCFKANVLEHESTELKRWEDLLAQCCSMINAYKADIVTTGDGFMREYIDQLQVIAAEPDLANFLMNMNSDQVTLECTKTVPALLGEKGPATRFCQIWFTSKQLHLTHVQVVKSLGLFDDESTSCLCKEFQTIRDSIFFPISVAQTLNRVSPKQSVAEMVMKLENMIAFNGHLAATLAAVVRCACPALPVLVAHHDFGGHALVPK